MVSTVIFTLLLVFFLLYAGVHAFLVWGASRTVPVDEIKEYQGFSIIIAAKNEERTIGPLLESVARLDYPAELFEVIVVNDRSTDGTAAVVRDFMTRIPSLTLIDIAENRSDMPHKKHALQNGITRARFRILAFTDADCILPEPWLQELSRQFTPETGMVAGYSPYVGMSMHTYIQYEEFKNTVIAGSALKAGFPFMCTGRNFAYRKQLFDEVGGFEGIKRSVSGDDDLFMQYAHRTTNWKMRYMTSVASRVSTQPPSSLHQFIHQRTRHISASRFYPRSIQMSFAAVHLFHVILAVSVLFEPFAALIFYCLKTNIDALLLVRGMSLFHANIPIGSFLINEPLLVLYSFVIGPLGYLKNFRWKESRP